MGWISVLFDPPPITVRFGEESPWRAEPPPRSLEPPQLAQECPGTSQTPARRLEAAPFTAVSHLRDPPPSPSHPISTANPTVRCLRPMALFASLCSFDHPDPLPTVSPRTILTFSVHAQAFAAVFGWECGRQHHFPQTPPPRIPPFASSHPFIVPFHRRSRLLIPQIASSLMRSHTPIPALLSSSARRKETPFILGAWESERRASGRHCGPPSPSPFPLPV